MTKTAVKTKKTRLKIALTITASVLVVIFAAGMIVTSVLMRKNFSRGDYRDPRFSAYYRWEHFQADYPRDEVSFKSGKNTLKGFIYGKDNDKGLIVFAHGIGGGHEGYINELLWFVDNGWRVFAYDGTGSGYSEGSGTRGLQQSALDLNAALTFAEGDERLSGMPVLLMGHSWGGYAAAAVLNYSHNITGVVSISGYNKPIDMIMEWVEDIGPVRYIMYPFVQIYNKSLFGRYSGLTAVGGINSSSTPVLVIHGKNDETVGYDKSSIISQKGLITNPSVRYLTLPDTGHNDMFHTKDANRYIENINSEYETLQDKFNGEIPEAEKEKFYAAVNGELINTTNEELLLQIESFLDEALRFSKKTVS